MNKNQCLEYREEFMIKKINLDPNFTFKIFWSVLYLSWKFYLYFLDTQCKFIVMDFIFVSRFDLHMSLSRFWKTGIFVYASRYHFLFFVYTFSVCSFFCNFHNFRDFLYNLILYFPCNMFDKNDSLGQIQDFVIVLTQFSLK